jgi:hypothetical protein
VAYRKKTWKEKLEDHPDLPKILKFDPKFPCGKALAKMGSKRGDSVVLAPGPAVDRIMKGVPKGKLITLDGICRRLARMYEVDYCCTLTTGIFVMTAARAAEDLREKGRKRVTLYWRTLKMDGVLNEKYPGGAVAQKRRLEEEGHKILRKGKRCVVEDWSKSVVKPD